MTVSRDSWGPRTQGRPRAGMATAAGAATIAPVLGAHRLVMDLVVLRYQQGDSGPGCRCAPERLITARRWVVLGPPDTLSVVGRLGEMRREQRWRGRILGTRRRSGSADPGELPWLMRQMLIS